MSCFGCEKNQRVHKANLWIIDYGILIIKADNKPAISLPVYFKFVKKMKICFTKKEKEKETNVSNSENRTQDHRRVK